MAGIYIHIPFCKQACNYCNFHFSTHSALQNDFIAALLKEIKLRASYFGKESVDTIYFGGGTPSLLPVSDIRIILNSLFENFNINENPEITLESNPDDMDKNKLSGWKEAGINRLSIGIQSFFEEDLGWMNRVHNASEAIRAMEETISSGFENFSLDLIYGLPEMTDKKWIQNLQKAISFNPTHISCYALTVEPKTALYKMIQAKKTSEIQPERQAVQFLTGIRELEAAGFDHYEISSFAKPGKRSRHNSAYWQSKKYVGLGPSAHSFNGTVREWNISNNALYIKSLMAGLLNIESEKLSPKDVLNEYIMTSLRTKEGLDLEHVSDNFGIDKCRLLENNVNKYIQLYQMERNEKKLILTNEGKLFADGIASTLFFD